MIEKGKEKRSAHPPSDHLGRRGKFIKPVIEKERRRKKARRFLYRAVEGGN